MFEFLQKTGDLFNGFNNKLGQTSDIVNSTTLKTSNVVVADNKQLLKIGGFVLAGLLLVLFITKKIK